MNKIIIGITGASGAIYANQLLDKLRTAKTQEISVVFSVRGEQVFRHELGDSCFTSVIQTYRHFANDDFNAPFASGSCDFNTMIILPCSMGTLARIANGFSIDLISRAADVMLKERRRLILVTRETPLNLVHIRNMQQFIEAGGIICPACPSFYHHPSSIEEIVDTVVNRILNIVGLENDEKRWGNRYF